MRLVRRLFPAVVAVAMAGAALGISTQQAEARVFVGLNFGVPLYGPAYYGPAYYGPYYAPRVVYAPAPVVVAPAPGVVTATPTSPTYLTQSGQSCREYQSSAVIDGQTKPVVGTACLQADGSWRVVK